MKFQKGQIPWNKGKSYLQMIGNKNAFGYKHTKEAKEKIRQAVSLRMKGNQINLGRHLLEETKRKIGLANKKPHFNQRGENNGLWKGNKVGYLGLHTWVARYLGKPDACKFCGKSGLKGRQIHWANKSWQYKRDLTDWLRLCAICHAKYDGNRSRRINQLVFQ